MIKFEIPTNIFTYVYIELKDLPFKLKSESFQASLLLNEYGAKFIKKVEKVHLPFIFYVFSLNGPPMRNVFQQYILQGP